MKNLINHGLMLALLFAASCSTTRHTTTSTVAVHDTVNTVKTDTMTVVKIRTNNVYVHDTVVGTPGKALSQTFAPDELAPARSASGRLIPRTYRKDTGNLHISVKVDEDGTVAIKAWDDSTSVIIQNLKETNTQLTDSLAHVGRSTTVEKSDAAASYSEYYTKSKSWLARHWILSTLLFVLLLASEVIYRLMRKPKRINPLLP